MPYIWWVLFIFMKHTHTHTYPPLPRNAKKHPIWKVRFSILVSNFLLSLQGCSRAECEKRSEWKMLLIFVQIRAWEIGVRYFIFQYFVTKSTLSPNGYTIDYVVVHWFDPNLKGSQNVSPAYSSPINQFCSLHNPSLHISKSTQSAHIQSLHISFPMLSLHTALASILLCSRLPGCVYICICVFLYLYLHLKSISYVETHCMRCGLRNKKKVKMCNWCVTLCMPFAISTMQQKARMK